MLSLKNYAPNTNRALAVRKCRKAYRMQVLLIAKLVVHGLALLLILRFLAQWWRVDRYNPVVAKITQYSDWLCGPLRQLLPWHRRIDFASLLLGNLLLLAWLAAVYAWFGQTQQLILTPIWALLIWVSLLLQLYFFLLLGLVIVSWVAPGSSHPLVNLIYEFTEPLAMPIRQRLPSIMGLDFSPMALFFIIFVLRKFLLIPLMQATGLPIFLTVWL